MTLRRSPERGTHPTGTRIQLGEDRRHFAHRSRDGIRFLDGIESRVKMHYPEGG